MALYIKVMDPVTKIADQFEFCSSVKFAVVLCSGSDLEKMVRNDITKKYNRKFPPFGQPGHVRGNSNYYEDYDGETRFFMFETKKDQDWFIALVNRSEVKPIHRKKLQEALNSNDWSLL